MAETKTGSAVATTGVRRDSRGFSGFSTNDLAKTKEFYAQALGLDMTEEMGLLRLSLAGGGGS